LTSEPINATLIPDSSVVVITTGEIAPESPVASDTGRFEIGVQLEPVKKVVVMANFSAGI
jgi:hypothetical protein